MTDELRTFRSDLASPSPAVEARVRRRLESRIAAESRAGQEGTWHGRPRRIPLAAGLAATACAAIALVAPGDLGDGPPSATGSAADRAAGSRWPAGWPGPGGRIAKPARSESPDGLVVSLPSLDGRDAGMRPTDDPGGWSECAISGCYWQS